MSALDYDEQEEFVDIRVFEGQDFAVVPKSVSLGDISEEWAVHTKRQRVSRFEEQHVVNVGKTNVLKINNYGLSSGEPSVYERELKLSGPGE